MEYNYIKHAKTLELNKILDALANEADLSDSAQMAREIVPSFDYDEVIYELGKTKAAYDLLGRMTAPSFSGAVDNASAIGRAKLGGMLNFNELLDIGSTLRTIRIVKTWRSNCEVKDLTDIDYLFDTLTANKYFEDKIFSSIKSEDDLYDNASVTLRDIRRKIVGAQANIREKLDRIVRGNSFSKFLQDAIITQRDGRFVVPVKSEHRSEISGIVHDTSSSGATLFIEPMAVVEINNDLRVLKSKENEEIERILFELSAEAGDFCDSIAASYAALKELCLIFAKAKYAYKINGIMPKINKNGRIILNNSRHPLIDKNQVVPISLTLGDTYNSLIITGPNTGGKTVTLKTIGLLSFMAMCGLFISADDRSEIAVFDKILVDIGDEQSIEQSLSTFSSHMVNIISIMKQTTSNSLVLLDELGAGTDPIEGAALAKSILINLKDKGAKIAATTHYAELKTYALETKNVENASCEFDVGSLKPTYKLLIGVPGSSNAFLISQKLGMPQTVIKSAQNYISEENKNFEKIVSSLEKERSDAEKFRIDAEKLKIQLENLKHLSEKKQSEIDKENAKIIERAHQKAEQIINNARGKSDLLINELEQMKKEFNRENANRIYQNAKQLSSGTINNLLDETNPVIQKDNSDYILPRMPIKNDSVLLVELNKEGIVTDVSANNKKVYVSAGNIKMWVDTDKIRLIENKKQQSKQINAVSGRPSAKDRVVTTEIDIRGYSVDEAVIELERFIDNAVITGINTVTIIHGKGTGVLRKGVQDYLRHNKCVKSFRVGTFGEGENGVTIAEINR